MTHETAAGRITGALAARTDGRCLVVERRLTSLVMLSGGVDSTYTLVKLLRETNDEVLAHHIHLMNLEGRHDIEAQRCRQIVACCKAKFRDFRYSESAIDHRGFRFFGYDIVSVGFEAGVVAHCYWLANHRPLDRWAIGHCLEEGSNPERLRHVLACFAANCFPQDPPPLLKMPVVSKREEVDDLPPQLLELVWTCRKPLRIGDEFRECGRCKTCILMAAVRTSSGTLTADGNDHASHMLPNKQSEV